MDKLLPVHKIIALLSILGLVLAFLLHQYVSEPAALEHAALTQEVQELKGKLKELKCPPDQTLLASLAQRIQTQDRELQDLDQRVMARYAAVYEAAISRNNWSLEAFMKQSPEPRRDFYVKEFDRVIRHSPYGDLETEEGSLGLTRESDSPQRNYLLLQLWCLESLLKQAHDNNLSLARLPREDRNTPPQTMRRRFRKPDTAEEKKMSYALQALPPRMMTIGGGEKTHSVLLAFRFRLGVKGNLDDVEGFLNSLGLPDTFFGIGAFEVKQLPPRKDGTPGAVQLNVECVTYVKPMNHN